MSGKTSIPAPTVLDGADSYALAAFALPTPVSSCS
jgi:hypothetical protein